MSLTEAQEVFASISETGLNDLITAFCTDRPRHLNYGSPAFVPTTTAAETSMASIPFPGVPGGIQWRVRLSPPRIDLYKQTDPLPPEITLQPGMFSASIGVELCLDCRRLKVDPKPPREFHGKEEKQSKGDTDGKGDLHPVDELTCCALKTFIVGHIEHVMSTSGEDAIALAVDAVEIVDIAPDKLESVLECLLFMILQAVLADIRIPLRALRVGAFSLTPAIGPLIEDDQIKMRGVFA
jgi:hypothetical protein